MVEYTRNYVTISIVWSIHINIASYVSSESKQLGVNQMCIMDCAICLKVTAA